MHVPRMDELRRVLFGDRGVEVRAVQRARFREPEGIALTCAESPRSASGVPLEWR